MENKFLKTPDTYPASGIRSPTPQGNTSMTKIQDKLAQARLTPSPVPDGIPTLNEPKMVKRRTRNFVTKQGSCMNVYDTFTPSPTKGQRIAFNDTDALRGQTPSKVQRLAPIQIEDRAFQPKTQKKTAVPGQRNRRGTIPIFSPRNMKFKEVRVSASLSTQEQDPESLLQQKYQSILDVLNQNKEKKEDFGAAVAQSEIAQAINTGSELQKQFEQTENQQADQKIQKLIETQVQQAKEISLLHAIVTKLVNQKPVDEIKDFEMPFKTQRRRTGKFAQLVKQNSIESTESNIQVKPKGRNAGCDFAFAFASPLVNTQGQPMERLDSNGEYEKIAEKLKTCGLNITMDKKVATILNFGQMLIQNPLGLHYSGHGENDYLCLEDESCQLARYDEQTLINKISIENDLQFVFLAACFSEKQLPVFQKTRAKHIICVEGKIEDKACLIFTETFYTHLLDNNSTVCKAYQLAIDDLTITNEGEANKIKIYVQGKQESGVHEPNTCAQFYQFKKGRPEFCHKQPIIHGKAPHVIINGRVKEQDDLIQKILSADIKLDQKTNLNMGSRCISVNGISGIGKSALTCNTVNFIQERARFDGCIYVNAKSIQSYKKFEKAIINKIIYDPNSSLMFSKVDIEKLTVREVLLKIFSNKSKFMFLFDNLDRVIEEKINKELLLKLIVTILDLSDNSKILLTSINALQTLSDHHRIFSFVLKPMQKQDSVDFFSQQAGLDGHNSFEEIFKILNMKFPTKLTAKAKKDAKAKWEEHEIWKIMNGNPQAILMTASLINSKDPFTGEEKTLSTVVEQLCSNPVAVIETMKDGNKKTSLTQILDKHIEECFAAEQNPERLRKFFILIEILSQQEVTLNSLREYWMQPELVEEYVHKLARRNLITVTEEDGIQKVEMSKVTQTYAKGLSSKTGERIELVYCIVEQTSHFLEYFYHNFNQVNSAHIDNEKIETVKRYFMPTDAKKPVSLSLINVCNLIIENLLTGETGQVFEDQQARIDQFQLMQQLEKNLNEARKEAQTSIQSQKNQIPDYLQKNENLPLQIKQLFDALMEINDKNSSKTTWKLYLEGTNKDWNPTIFEEDYHQTIQSKINSVILSSAFKPYIDSYEKNEHVEAQLESINKLQVYVVELYRYLNYSINFKKDNFSDAALIKRNQKKFGKQNEYYEAILKKIYEDLEQSECLSPTTKHTSGTLAHYLGPTQVPLCLGERTILYLLADLLLLKEDKKFKNLYAEFEMHFKNQLLWSNRFHGNLKKLQAIEKYQEIKELNEYSQKWGNSLEGFDEVKELLKDAISLFSDGSRSNGESAWGRAICSVILYGVYLQEIEYKKNNKQKNTDDEMQEENQEKASQEALNKLKVALDGFIKCKHMRGYNFCLKLLEDNIKKRNETLEQNSKPIWANPEQMSELATQIQKSDKYLNDLDPSEFNPVQKLTSIKRMAQKNDQFHNITHELVLFDKKAHARDRKGLYEKEFDYKVVNVFVQASLEPKDSVFDRQTTNLDDLEQDSDADEFLQPSGMNKIGTTGAANFLRRVTVDYEKQNNTISFMNFQKTRTIPYSPQEGSKDHEKHIMSSSSESAESPTFSKKMHAKSPPPLKLNKTGTIDVGKLSVKTKSAIKSPQIVLEKPVATQGLPKTRTSVIKRTDTKINKSKVSTKISGKVDTSVSPARSKTSTFGGSKAKKQEDSSIGNSSLFK